MRSGLMTSQPYGQQDTAVDLSPRQIPSSSDRHILMRHADAILITCMLLTRADLQAF